MITSLIPYIAFPGTCKEALDYYKEVLQGEITILQTFGEAPLDFPKEFQDRIFNSELKTGDITIKASDDLSSNKTADRNNISLYVVFSEKQTKENVFNRLAEGGNVLFPIKDNFGMLIDKYGIKWMLSHK